MYQIKYVGGWEIQVIGKGVNGLSRVLDSLGNTRYEGGYQACCEWLQDRGIAVWAGVK